MADGILLGSGLDGDQVTAFADTKVIETVLGDDSLQDDDSQDVVRELCHAQAAREVEAGARVNLPESFQLNG